MSVSFETVSINPSLLDILWNLDETLRRTGQNLKCDKPILNSLQEFSTTTILKTSFIMR
jgi:hypothetical protein